MADERNQDRLEAFFKRQLAHYEEDPGADFWASLEGQIPARPGFPLWLWLQRWWPALLIGVLLTMVIILVAQQQKITGLQQKIGQQQEQIQEYQHLKPATGEAQTQANQAITERKNIATTNTKRTVSENLQNADSTTPLAAIDRTQRTLTTTGAQNIPPAFTNPSQTTPEENPFHESGNTSKLPFRANQGEAPLTEQGIDQDSTHPEAASNILLRENRSSFPDFSAIALRQMALLGPEENDTLGAQIWEKVKPLYPHFYYGAGGLAGTTFLPFPSDLDVTPFTSDYGFFIHSGLQWSKRWSVATGIQIVQKNMDITYNTSFNYQPVGEPGSAGERFHQYSEELGELIRIKSELQYIPLNNPEDLQPGDTFAINSTITYQLRYFQVPLWLRYKIGEKRFVYELQAGIIFNHLMGGQVTGQSVQFDQQQVSLQQLTVEPLGLQDNYTDLSFGNTFIFEWTPNIHLTGEMQLRYSMNPVFDQNTFTLGGGLGLRYQF